MTNLNLFYWAIPLIAANWFMSGLNAMTTQIATAARGTKFQSLQPYEIKLLLTPVWLTIASLTLFGLNGYLFYLIWVVNGYIYSFAFIVLSLLISGLINVPFSVLAGVICYIVNTHHTIRKIDNSKQIREALIQITNITCSRD